MQKGTRPTGGMDPPSNAPSPPSALLRSSTEALAGACCCLRASAMAAYRWEGSWRPPPGAAPSSPPPSSPDSGGTSDTVSWGPGDEGPLPLASLACLPMKPPPLLLLLPDSGRVRLVGMGATPSRVASGMRSLTGVRGGSMEMPVRAAPVTSVWMRRRRGWRRWWSWTRAV